jgi:hypothetical protein
MPNTLSDWANVATVLGAILGVIALGYTGLQIRQATRTQRADFWLTLRQMFAEHQEIHRKLRDGEWPNDDVTYPDEDDWAKLEAYMGLFEHCEIMLEDRILDWRTFYHIYRYRIELILSNPLIVRDKLIRRREGWERFLNLVRRMQRSVGKEVRHGVRFPGAILVGYRYLCGFYDPRKACWTLWWGTLTHREACPARQAWESPRYLNGCCDFDDRAAMHAAYHARLAVETPRAEGVAFAWLVGDRHELLHRWPEGGAG